jgi:Polysaccharide deacetylase
MDKIIILLCVAVCVNINASKQLVNLPPTQKARIKITDRVWPEKYGQADVCLWKDDKLAAFSITIDDNTAPDHEYWMKLGDKYGYKFTWFIIVNRLKRGGYHGTWAGFQKLVDKGHEVQSHSVSHRDKKINMPLDKDYGDAIAPINTNLKNNRCLTLAYPGGALPNDPNVAKKYYIGCRWVVGVQNKTATTNYISINSIGNFANFFKPEKHWASFAGMLNPKNRGKFRNWYCTHFHSVSNGYAQKKKIKENLETVLGELKKNEKDVWIGKFTEVVQYGQERDTAKLKNLKVAPDRISFSLTDDMKDDVFDYPLTVKVRLDKGWSKTNAAQNGKPVNAQIVEHNGAKFALVQAVPDCGKIVITK